MKRDFMFDVDARQSGSTLVISMIVLVVIMLLGTMAMVTSDTQYKLAGNLQFQDAAMNNAETAITTAENWLASDTNYADTAFTTYDPSKPHLYPIGYLEARAAPNNSPLTMDWSDNNSIQVDNDDQRYIIELMSVGNRLSGSGQTIGGRASSGCNQVNTYRITARGASARGTTRFVQSYYSVLSCPPPA